MRVHFLGIGGSGASAAAAIAETQGFEVTGCDLEPNNEFTTQFKPSQLFKGHAPKHIKNIDILAVTPAIYSLDPDNPELVAAKKHRIPIMTWQEFLGKYLTKDKFVIAVAGTHGKTTTTTMIASMLEDGGLDPTVVIGAIVPKWRANYKVGKSKYFVVEADEYNDNFLSLHTDISVVTNIEYDHPEYFKDFKAYQESFDKFKSKSKKIIDQPNPKLINFALAIPGEFNILNASLVYQVGLLLKINPEKIKESLSNYTGISRRFEYLGDFKGAKIYTDFGHHPTEIKTTMEAAREKFPKSRIWLIFEPHMFTRTKAFFNDFVKIFREIPIDKIIITDIYQSREADKGLVTSKQLANAAGKPYIAKDKLNNYLEKSLKENDIVFFMGAGDMDKIAKKFIS
ncbi:MAG: UDP-N-acetylmuramate-L-alanine ligase [Microgenomates group bacterium Gr01-1014_7]|nr:MAG: UDP-N-acetylmuramate-L-alanine ligase [Microgenomates group bacterium Gr01-1014_7]